MLIEVSSGAQELPHVIARNFARKEGDDQPSITRYFREIESFSPLRPGEILIFSPATEGRWGRGSLAVVGPDKIDESEVGIGFVYDPDADRLVRVKYHGKFRGVSSRNGWFSAARVRGDIFWRGEPREKWLHRQERAAVFAAIAEPPIAGEIDPRAMRMMAVHVALQHNALINEGALAVYFETPSAAEVERRAAYKAAQAAAMLDWRTRALEVVRQCAPEGARVETWDQEFGFHAFWARIDSPWDPDFEASEDLQLVFEGRGRIFVFLPGENASYGVGLSITDTRRTPEFHTPAGSSGVGTFDSAPDWLVQAGRALLSLELPAWPASHTSQPD